MKEVEGVDRVEVVRVRFVQVAPGVEQQPEEDRAQRVEPVGAMQDCEHNFGSA